MKIKNLITLFAFILISLVSCTAKQGYEIKISSNDIKNEKIHFAHYFMGSLLDNDSIILDNSGKGVFKGKERLKEGNYVIYLEDGSYVDLIIGEDQTFSIQLDTINMPENVSIKGANEPKEFLDYTLLFFKNKKEIQNIASNAIVNSEADRDSVLKLIEPLKNEVENKKEELIKKYKGKMISIFLEGYDVPQPPEFKPDGSVTNIDSASAVFYYGFFRDNYLKNIDLSDERSYYTPYIRQRIDTYLNKVLVQRYDSIIPNAINLVERSTPNDSAFKIMASYMLRYATNYDLPGFLDMRHIMGIDNLIVELADRYYLNGKAFWADSTQIAEIKKKADKIRYCQIGKPAANIPLAKIGADYDSLYNYCGTIFTVVVFYEPDCGHCQQRLPIISSFYSKYVNDPRVSVVAICMKDSEAEVKTFINTYKTGNLTNVWDPMRKSEYWKMFDTSETPMIYILDADKKIEAKNIEPEQLFGIAEFKLK